MIPKSFKFGAEVISVEEFDSLDFEKTLGDYTKGSGIIRLSNKALGFDVPDSSKERTFFHELTHAILYHIGECELSDNERFVDALSGVLHQYIKENYVLKDGIQE